MSLIQTLHFACAEGCSSPQGDQSSSLLVPPALPDSGCPLPRLSPSTSVLPRLLSTLADNRQTEVRLQGPRECPQNTKPPNGSIGARPTKLSQKQPVPCPASAKQQKKVHRHRTTNGWRPFGEPTEKEVFIAVSFVPLVIHMVCPKAFPTKMHCVAGRGHDSTTTVL